MEFGGLKPCTSNSPDSSRKRNRKRKPAELGESDGLSGKKLKRISALAEAAAKIDPSHLADFFAKPVSACTVKFDLFCLMNSDFSCCCCCCLFIALARHWPTWVLHLL